MPVAGSLTRKRSLAADPEVPDSPFAVSRFGREQGARGTKVTGRESPFPADSAAGERESDSRLACKSGKVPICFCQFHVSMQHRASANVGSILGSMLAGSESAGVAMQIGA